MNFRVRYTVYRLFEPLEYHDGLEVAESPQQMFQAISRIDGIQTALLEWEMDGLLYEWEFRVGSGWSRCR